MSFGHFFYRLVKIEELHGFGLPQNYEIALGEDAFKCAEDKGIGDEDCSRTTYGNVFMIDNQAMVVLKSEYNKSGRNSAVVKFKLKDLLTESISEFVFKADDKFDPSS